MKTIIFPLLAGIFIALQSVFNARLGDKIGSWETIAVVHFTGFLAALAAVLFFGKGSFDALRSLQGMDRIYLLGGVLGVLIIATVIKGISLLGVTLAITILLVSQILTAYTIDVMGLFGTVPIHFTWTKPLGILIMVAGIVIFQLKI